MPELFCGLMQSKTVHHFEHCGHNFWSCKTDSAEIRVYALWSINTYLGFTRSMLAVSWHKIQSKLRHRSHLSTTFFIFYEESWQKLSCLMAPADRSGRRAGDRRGETRRGYALDHTSHLAITHYCDLHCVLPQTTVWANAAGSNVSSQLYDSGSQNGVGFSEEVSSVLLE